MSATDVEGGSPARCWICGAESEMVDATTLGEAQRRFIPGMWPASNDGHRHAERPPTPSEMVAEGHDILRGILEWRDA